MIREYCGNEEFAVAQFSITLSEDIQAQIKNKTLFYKEQIQHYMIRKTNNFLKSLSLQKNSCIRLSKANIV